jgi:hypothetical protein
VQECNQGEVSKKILQYRPIQHTHHKPLGPLFYPTNEELTNLLIKKKAGTLNHYGLIEEVDDIYRNIAIDLGGIHTYIIIE